MSETNSGMETESRMEVYLNPDCESEDNDTTSSPADIPFKNLNEFQSFLRENRTTLDECIKQELKNIEVASTLIKIVEELPNSHQHVWLLTELRATKTERQVIQIQDERDVDHTNFSKERALKERRIVEFVELKQKMEEETIRQATDNLIKSQAEFQYDLEQKNVEKEPEKLEWTEKIDRLKEENASYEQEIRTKTRSIQRLQVEIEKFRASEAKSKKLLSAGPGRRRQSGGRKKVRVE